MNRPLSLDAPEWLERVARARDLGAFTRLDVERARAELRGSRHGPLAGHPLLVKDNIDVGGFVTGGGTAALASNAPARRHADVVRVLVDAGMVCLGKTNLHELALGVTSVNAATGPVRNPHDPTRHAGGSSGGAAVAVATGVAAVALGTDTGGSCRIPAAHCGVVGFRPTTGRYSADGVLTISPSRDTIGWLGRTVAVIEEVDAVIARAPAVSSPRALVLGRPSAQVLGELEPAVAAAYEASCARFAAAGVRLVPVDLREVFALDERCGFPIAMYETAAELRRVAGARLSMTLEEWLPRISSPDVRALLETFVLRSPVPAADYARALGDTWPLLRNAYDAALAGVDAIVLPTSPATAGLVSAPDTVSLPGATVPAFPTYTRFTRPDSMAGLPSVSLVAPVPEGALPVGVMLVGARDRDRELLAACRALESMLAT